jgi:hypothetical protein
MQQNTTSPIPDGSTENCLSQNSALDFPQILAGELDAIPVYSLEELANINPLHYTAQHRLAYIQHLRAARARFNEAKASGATTRSAAKAASTIEPKPARTPRVRKPKAIEDLSASLQTLDLGDF